MIRRRDRFDRDPAGFLADWAGPEAELRGRILSARDRLAAITVPDSAVERAAMLCMALGTDGLRGELTLIRAARALAALEGSAAVGDAELRRIAPPALRHRLRRNPLDEAVATTRVERAIADLFGP